MKKPPHIATRASTMSKASTSMQMVASWTLTAITLIAGATMSLEVTTMTTTSIILPSSMTVQMIIIMAKVWLEIRNDLAVSTSSIDNDVKTSLTKIGSDKKATTMTSTTMSMEHTEKRLLIKTTMVTSRVLNKAGQITQKNLPLSDITMITMARRTITMLSMIGPTIMAMKRETIVDTRVLLLQPLNTITIPTSNNSINLRCGEVDIPPEEAAEVALACTIPALGISATQMANTAPSTAPIDIQVAPSISDATPQHTKNIASSNACVNSNNQLPRVAMMMRPSKRKMWIHLRSTTRSAITATQAKMVGAQNRSRLVPGTRMTIKSTMIVKCSQLLT